MSTTTHNVATPLDIKIVEARDPATFPVTTRYTLFYREGRNPHPQFSFIDFPSSSTIMNVVARAKEFCDKMGYRFVNIQQSVIDMEKEEARRRGE